MPRPSERVHRERSGCGLRALLGAVHEADLRGASPAPATRDAAFHVVER
jgi:hypothetical protein